MPANLILPFGLLILVIALFMAMKASEQRRKELEIIVSDLKTKLQKAEILINVRKLSDSEAAREFYEAVNKD